MLSYLHLVLSQVFFEQSLFHGLVVFSIYVPELSWICTQFQSRSRENYSLIIGRKITDLNLLISSNKEIACVDKLQT